MLKVGDSYTFHGIDEVVTEENIGYLVTKRPGDLEGRSFVLFKSLIPMMIETGIIKITKITEAQTESFY